MKSSKANRNPSIYQNKQNRDTLFEWDDIFKMVELNLEFYFLKI